MADEKTRCLYPRDSKPQKKVEKFEIEIASQIG